MEFNSAFKGLTTMWLSAQDLRALTKNESFNYYREHLITCFSVLLIAVFIRAVPATILIVF
jgi:hypothetical protein